MTRHAAFAACLLLWAAGASAQAPEAQSLGFFTRYDFHLSADALSIDDPRFSWDTHFGGDLDIVDYVSGRLTLVADYEAILGSQLRAFDPEQAYYTLEVASSYRTRFAEVAGTFHHVSRHLSDRPKDFGIDWNVIGARVAGQLDIGQATIDVRADGGYVVVHSYVDYQWTGKVDVMIRRAFNPHVGVFAHGYGDLYGVDGSIVGRGTQRGGMVEGGVRLTGRAGAVELFAGYENRVDADPVNLVPKQWGLAGFRLLSK